MTDKVRSLDYQDGFHDALARISRACEEARKPLRCEVCEKPLTPSQFDGMVFQCQCDQPISISRADLRALLGAAEGKINKPFAEKMRSLL